MDAKLPQWMRAAMLATAPVNLGGAVVFLPPGEPYRALVGLPAEGHPFYLATIAAFIFINGCAYTWAGVTGRAGRLFVASAAAGKASFFGLLLVFWLLGSLPGIAPALGAADLAFAALFVAWLLAPAPQTAGAAAVS